MTIEISCDEVAIITDFETGEKICQSCGKVLQQNISDPRKVRSFSGEENRSHVGDGTSITLYYLGLSTIIGRINFRKPFSNILSHFAKVFFNC